MSKDKNEDQEREPRFRTPNKMTTWHAQVKRQDSVSTSNHHITLVKLETYKRLISKYNMHKREEKI